MKKLILNLGLLAVLCWPAAAGEIMTYQGRLKESGTPVTANRNFLFEFCSDELGTTCTASLSGTKPFAVANGLFKSTFTVPEVDLSSGPWYLRVTVGGQPLSPLEMLTAVPYAVQAASAAYASALAVSSGEGVFASTNIIVSGFAGLGTSSPRYRLDSEGSIRIFNAAQAPSLIFTANSADIPGVSGYGASVAGVPESTAMGIMIRTQSLANYSERLRVSGTGNVGISTGVPQARLDVLSAGSAPSDMSQIWRNSSGLIVASMSATGQMQAVRYIGDGSGLTGVTGASGTDPNALPLAGGTMLGAIDMAGNFLAGVSTITLLNGSVAIVPPGTGGTNSEYGISIGSNAYDNYLSGVGVGRSARSNAAYGVGVGYGAESNSYYGVGVGAYSAGNFNYGTGVGAYTSSRSSSAALGYYARAINIDALALGAGSKANAFRSIAIGAYTVNDATGTANFGAYNVNAPAYWINGSTVVALMGNGSLALGPMAGAVNAGNYNVFVGSAAGKVVTGSENTMVGYGAGLVSVAAERNTFIGMGAGDSNVNGDDNIVIGKSQNASDSGASYELNIGGLLFGKLDEKVIGISTRAPQAALDIVSTGTLPSQMAQIWRDSNGIVKSSMSATGVLMAAKFIGDGSGLTGASATDSTKLLKSGDTMTGQLTVTGSTLTVIGPTGPFPGVLWVSTSVSQPIFYVSTMGYAGINTSAPGYPLQIASRQGQTALQIDGYDSSWDTLSIESKNSGQPNISYVRGGLLKANTYVNGSDNFMIDVDGGTRLALTKDGKVGVGSATPLYALHVSSGAGMAGDLLVITTGTANVVRLTGEGRVYANKFYGDGSALTGITADLANASGTLDIGDGGTGATTAPGALTSLGALPAAGGTMTGQLTLAGSSLTVSNLGTNLGLYADVGGGNISVPGGQSLYFKTSGSNRMHIDNVGNIAVNKTPANYLLDVGGAANFDGQAIVGGTMTVAGAHFSIGGSTLVVREGRVGIGTSAPDQKLSVEGGISQTGVFRSSGTGASYFAGSVGIGTGAPVNQLHVYSSGEAIFGQSVSAVSTDAAVRGWTNDAAAAVKGVATGSGYAGRFEGPVYMTGQMILDGTATVKGSAFSVGGSSLTVAYGKVGIGTDLPASRFELANGSVTISGSEAGLLFDGPARKIAPTTNADLGAGLYVSTNVFVIGFSSAARYYGDGSALTGVTASGSVLRAGDTMTGQLTLAGSTLTVTGNAFSVGGSTLAVHNGRVGVLTALPAEALDIGGRIMISTSAGNDATDGLYSYGMNGMAFSSNGQNYMRVSYNAQNVAIGGASVLSGGSYPRVQIPENMSIGSSFAAFQAPTNGLSVQGKVGIGTATPTALLDVRDQNATHGFVLRVGTGTASDSASLVVTTGGIVGVGIMFPSSQTYFHANMEATDRTVGVEDISLGLIGSVRVAGGGMEDAAAGGHFEVKVEGAADLGIAAGLHTSVRRGNGAGAVGRVMGLFVENFENEGGVGAITNTYGVYLSTLSMPGQTNQPYAIYSEDTKARTYFAGNVGISSATPSHALVISSAAGSSDVMLVVSTGSSVIFGVKGNGEVFTAGKFIGDGSALTNISVAGDGLGSHIATTTLQMGAYGINSSSAVSAAVYQIGASTVLASVGTFSLSLGRFAATTAGADSLFLGDYAGGGNPSGGNNTIVGNSAAYNSTSGSYNTYVGFGAGNQTATGLNNVAVGANASTFNSNGSGNAILGMEAGRGVGGNSFSSSTLAGYRAGYSLSNGSANNVLIGWQAGDSITAGADNIVIGYDQDTSAAGASDELNIGGVVYGDLSAKTIGISTRAPQAALDVVSTGTAANIYAQIWRDGSGVVVASVSSLGRFSGDGSGLVGVSDNSRISRTGDVFSGTYMVNAGTFSLNNTSFHFALRDAVIISTGDYFGSPTTFLFHSGRGAIRGGLDYAGRYDPSSVGNLTIGFGYGALASGSYATVSGGSLNEATNNGAAVGGGYSNKAYGSSAVIPGGDNNEARGDGSAVGGGGYNVVSGSHSVIPGGAYNTVTGTSSVVGGGEDNEALGFYSSVAGGLGNRAAAQYSAVGGGWLNNAFMWGASIGGGVFNQASMSYATIAGGSTNTASGYGSFVGGGDLNQANGSLSSVSGGTYQVANGERSFIGGGAFNTVDGQYGVIAGGNTNKISSGYAGFIGGGELNRSTGTHAVVGGGYMNVSSGAYSAVLGGQANTAIGAYAAVGGGIDNTGSGYAATVSGGQSNFAALAHSAVAGGMNNRADGQYSFVGGGYQNDVDGTHAAIAGGWFNQAMNMDSFIGGGLGNIINTGGDYASIVGGSSNTVTGQYAAVLGGQFNQALSVYSVVVGGLSNMISATNPNAFIGGGQSNNIASSGQFAVVGGGWDNEVYSKYSVIAGGQGNRVFTGNESVVVGGSTNTASGTASAVVGGAYNSATGMMSFVGGGGPYGSEVTGNQAAGSHSAVVGGSSNTVSGAVGFIGGGWDNRVGGDYGAVSGGSRNSSSGQWSAIPGGSDNSASGDYAFSAGYKSSSTANGTFTWNDSFPSGFLVNNVVNQAMFKTSGGFWVSTGTIYQTPALYVSPNNNVVLGTAAVRSSRLTVAEPNPHGLTGNEYVLRVGTGTIPQMLSVSTAGAVTVSGDLNARVWQRIFSVNLSANMTVFSIPNLRGNTDEQYRLRMRVVNTAVGLCTVQLRPNADSTTANYTSQFYGANAAGAVNYVVNPPGAFGYIPIGVAGTGALAETGTLIEGTLYARASSEPRVYSGTMVSIMGTTTRQVGGSWNGTGAEITALNINTDVAGCLGSGTHIELWAFR